MSRSSAKNLAYLVTSVAALVVSGCATKDDVRAMRQPPMPPTAIAQATEDKAFFENVSIQEVYGAPEFRWFDGGSVLTTRPTRVQVLRTLQRQLRDADMLAPSRLDSEYMLYVEFKELKGPNVWVTADKLASSSIVFRLVRWRTNELIYEQTVDSEYRVRWVGITPDNVRAAIAGPIGVARDYPGADLGGFLGGLALGYYVNGTLSAEIGDVPYAALAGGVQAATIGGPSQFADGFEAAALAALAAGAYTGHISNFEAALAGGLISGVSAARGPAVPTTAVSVSESFGPLNGTKRRMAATQGMLELAFDRFMNGLLTTGNVEVKTAVSCRSLNKDGIGPAYLASTTDKFGIDCPGSRTNIDQTRQMFPYRLR